MNLNYVDSADYDDAGDWMADVYGDYGL
jgi:hypothetical protein